jgi:hypothetical protein
MFKSKKPFSLVYNLEKLPAVVHVIDDKNRRMVPASVGSPTCAIDFVSVRCKAGF